MQRFPRVTSWSSGEVTFTISSSCTCSVRLQPTPQYGQTVSTSVCSASSQVPAWRSSNSLVHQRAGRAHGDAVAAVHARRLGQRDVELSRDVRLEAAARDRDRERVLVVDAAGLDALVTEDALRVVAHVEVVVDLHRLRDGRASAPKRSGSAPYSLDVALARRARWRGRPRSRAARAPCGGSCARARSRCARPSRARPCASTRARARARPRPRRRRRGRRSPASACRRNRVSASRCRAGGTRRGSSSPR